MAPQSHLWPAVEKRIGPAPPRPGHLDVSVIYTSPETTLAAIKAAGAMAESLHARITIIVLQVVSIHVPLPSPPVLLEFQEAQMRAIAEQSPVETTVQIYLCRDYWEMLRSVLKPHSLVILGTRRKWWLAREERWARKLRRTGH